MNTSYIGEFCTLADGLVLRRAAALAPIPDPPPYKPSRPRVDYGALVINRCFDLLKALLVRKEKPDRGRPERVTVPDAYREYSDSWRAAMQDQSRRIAMLPAGVTVGKARVSGGGVEIGTARNVTIVQGGTGLTTMQSPLDAYMTALGWELHGEHFGADAYHVTDPHGRYWLLPRAILRGDIKDLEFWIMSRTNNAPSSTDAG